MVAQLSRPANDTSVQAFLAIADAKLSESTDTGLLDTDKASAAADRRAARAAKAAVIADQRKDAKGKGKDKPAARAKTQAAKTDKTIDEKNAKASRAKYQKSVKTEDTIEVKATPIDDGIPDQVACEALPTKVVEIKPGVHIVKLTEASLAVTVKADNLITAGLKEIAVKSEQKEAAKKSAKVKTDKKPKEEKPALPKVDHVKMIRPSSAPSEKVKLEDGKTKKLKLNDYTIEAKADVSAIATDTKIFHIFTAMSVANGATLAEISTACGVSMTESYTVNRVTMRGYGVKKTTGEDGIARFSLVLPAGLEKFRTR